MLSLPAVTRRRYDLCRNLEGCKVLAKGDLRRDGALNNKV